MSISININQELVLRQRQKKMSLAFLFVFLWLSAIYAVGMGAVQIDWLDFPRLLWGNAESLSAEDKVLRLVLLNVRLPRVALAMLSGGVLAMAGASMQALFRNPLAEPGLMGVSMGAALGAVTAIVLFSAGLWLIAGFAFAGSLLSAMIAYVIGRRYGGIAGLLLAGIAINAIGGSVIGLLTYMANDVQLRDLTFWSMGSLAGGNWIILAFITPWSIACLVFLYTQWRAMNALLLGEREVVHLGFSMQAIRIRLVLGIALVVGPLVAVTGGIAFVGLVVPHMMRFVLGANHRYLLPASLLGGAVLMIWADCAARVLIIPAELPVGLITSLIGGPFFLWLLLRVRAR